MTDNEIIKAFEKCIKNDILNKNCVNCDYRKHGNACMDVLFGQTLDLLNRLQADKDALIAGQETLQKHIAEQKAEIERLKTESIKQQLKKEMHRLTVEEIKVEAIKEFAERLKQKKFELDEFDVVEVDEIDNIASKLISEKCVNQAENYTGKCANNTADYCIVCGKPVPEGRHICPMCENGGVE